MSDFKKILVKSLILLILFNLFSCISLKDIQLIQPDPNLKLDKNGYILFNDPEYHIQVNDQILINVATSSGTSMGMLSNFITGGNNVTSGNSVYVRKDGNIELPRIGFIKLEGLTIAEARKAVQTEFYKIYNEQGTWIDVNLAGIQYTMVGEGTQGIFVAPKNRLTLLDAFAQAGGGQNIYANLKKIRIIRSEIDGTKQVYVDLTKETIMNSEYYWVKNKDIIVVSPRPQKIWGIGLNPLSILTAITSSITAILGFYYLFRRKI